MVRSSALRLVAAVVFLAVVTPLYATTYSSTQTGNWSSASTWGGSGVPGVGDTATVNGGHVVTLDVSVTLNTLTLAGGQITGTNSLNVTNVFNWNSGTLSGAGSMQIASGTVGGGGTLDARTLIINGSLAVNGGNYFYMQNGAQVTNNGTIEFVSDGSGIFQSGSLGTMAITNAGTIKKSGGTGSSTVGMPITGQSGSQLLAQSGTLNIAAVTATGSTFDASSGATMQFNTGDTRSLDATCTVSGAGTMYWSSGTNNIAANYAVTGVTKSGATTTIGTSITSTGDLVVNGGTLSLNNSTTLSVNNLSMQGGTLAGNAPITLTGSAQSWTGGTFAGTGLLTIPSGTTVTFSGFVHFDTRSVSNAGSMVYTSNYYSYFYNSATLTNSGTVNFQGDGGFYIGSGSPSITNSGTIEKTGGTGQGGIQVSLLSQSGSQISIQSGTILFGSVSATGTALTVSSGAIAEFYYTTSSSFDSTSSISGAGTVLFAAGTNSISAAYNITGATNNSGGTTTIGSNVTSVGSMTSTGGALTVNNSSPPTTGTVTVTSGTLTLNYASTLTLATLLMQGGTLAGTAPIALTGSAMTWTGGTVGGTGSFTVPAGTTITFNGFVYFDTRTVTNGGAFTYSGNYYSYLYNSLSFTNNGTITFQGDGGLYIGSGSPTIVNNGTITKSGGTGQGGIQPPLTASAGSQINIQSGTLLFGNVTATGAAFNVSSGATMQMNYTTTSSFDAASSISGAGNVVFAAGTNTVSAAYNVTGATNNSGGTTTIGSNVTSVGGMTCSGGSLTVNNTSAPTTGTITMIGGTLTLNYSSTLTIATLTMQGGTLGGTASISLTGSSMTWTGGTVAGSGSLTIPNGTSIAFNGFVSFDTRTITNGGAWTYSSNYYSYLYNTAVLTNNGTITFQGDGGFYIGAGSPSIINNGTITKSAGTGTGAIQVSLTAQSGSQLQVQSGGLLLGNVAATSAAFSISSGASLATYYTTTSSFDAASSISGAGTMGFGAGTNTVNAAYNVTGATKSTGGTTTLTSITSTGDIIVSGGTLTLNSGSAISVPTLTMQGGILNGTAPIGVTATSMTWSGGTIGGSGTLTIPSLTTVTIGGTTSLDTRPLSNAGKINFTSTYVLYMQNNAVLTNTGTIDFQGDSSVYLNSVAGTTAINNFGVIKKSAGSTSGTSISVQLNLNSGSQFQIQASTVYFGNVSSLSGTLSVASGAVAYMYYTTSANFDAGSTVSGAGTVQFYAGATTVNGTYNITGATKSAATTTIGPNITSTGDVTLAGGTLTLNSASAISVPTFTISGGTLLGNAPINITGSAQSWTGGTIAGTGSMTIPNTTTTTVSGSTTLDTRTINNAGTIVLPIAVYLYFQNNAVLNNSGIIDVQADGHLYQSGAVGTTMLTNSGTIKKSGGATGSSFSVPITLQSGGQLLVQASIAYLGNITSNGGTLNLASGTTAYLYYTSAATFDSASTISGSGTLQNGAGTNSVAGTISTPILLTGGTLAINSATTQSVPTFTIQGGTLSGSGTLAVTGAAMTWTGGVIGGTGTLSIPAGTTVTVSGVVYLDTRTLGNAGTMTFTSTNYMYIQNNAVLNNSGLIDFPGNNDIELNGTAGTTMVNDSGTIRKSGGTTSYFTAPLTLQSGGQFLVQSGTVYFGNITGSGGTLNTSSGATSYLYYTTAASFDAASTISGSGTLNNGAGTNTFAGTITSPLTVSGGTLAINSASTQSIPVLTMTGGTLNGTGNIAVTSAAMTWSGGTIAGSGTFTIPSGTTITIGGVPFLDTRAFTNAGTITFSSSNYIYMQNGASLNNTGTINFPGDNAIYLNTGAPTLTNNGLITKTGGVGTSPISVPVTNAASGVIEPLTGTIQFNNLTENGTLYFPIAGATSFGRVYVPTAFVLGGTLHATTTGGYTPVNGTAFQVLTYTSVSGGFASKNLTYSGGGQFTDSYTASAMTLTAGNANCTAVPSNAVAWYRAEGDTTDSAGVNLGAISGGVTYATGEVGQGFSLDGSSGSVNVPLSSSLQLTNGTIEFWMKGDPTNAFGCCQGLVATQMYAVEITGGAVSFAVSTDSGVTTPYPAATAAISTNAWHHVAGTYDGSTINLYIDGVLAASTPHTGSISSNGGFLSIGSEDGRAGACNGCQNTSGRYFKGLLDEVTIYNRALTAAEVQTIYNVASAGKCFNSSTPTITGFSPSSGGAGTTVTINGTNFIGTSAVAFNGTPAASFTINSASQITAVVAAGTTTGPISVTTTGGVATSAASFTFSCTPPIATVTAPSTVCGNATGVGASVTTTAGATYNWSITNGTITGGQGTSAITFNPGATGVVNLNVTVTDATSCSANGNANVTINPAPASAITAPPSICTSSTGNASVAATGGATYNWTITNGTITGGSGTNAITFTPAASGSVSLAITVVSTNGCSSSSSAAVPINAAPSATITAPASACASGSGNASVPFQSGATYNWTVTNGTITGGAGTSAITFTAGASGSVSISVNVANGGCSATSNVTVPINGSPAPVITGPSTTCAGSPVTLDAGAGFSSYLWSTGATTQTITVSPATTTSYSVTVTNGSGCSGTTSYSVTANPLPPSAITAPPSICSTATGNASVTATGGATYNWSILNGTITGGAGTNAITFTPGASGNVTVAITVTSAGCSSNSSVSIPINGAPSSTITAPPAVCASTVANANVAAQAGATYNWSITNGAINSGAGTNAISFTAGASGNVTLNLTVSNGGCSNSSSVTIPINAVPAPVITGPATTCAGSPVTLDAGAGFSSYLWSTGAVTRTITVSPSVNTTYSVSVSNGSCSASTSHPVTVSPAPSAAINAPASVTPSSASNGASVPSTPGATYTWSIANGTITSGQSTNAISFTAGPSGNVTLGVTVTGVSCSATGSANVPIVSLSGDVSVSVAASPNSVAVNSPVAFTVVVSNSGPGTAMNVSVSNSISSPTATFVGTSSLISCGSPINGTVTCTAPFLSPGDSATITITWNATTTDPVLTMSSSVTSSNDSNNGNNAASAGATVNQPQPEPQPSGNPCANPTATSLVSPANGASLGSSTVHFTWTSVSGASGYRLWVAVNGAPFVSAGDTAGTSMDVNISSGSVEWYVETLFTGCSSVESSHRTFSIPPKQNCGANGAAANLSPTTDVSSPSVQFNWSPAAGATGYEVWLSLNGGTPTLLGTTSSISLTHDVPPGALEWFVRANFDGCPQTESAHVQFNYNLPVQCSDSHPAAVAPLNNSLGLISPINFSWKEATGAASYKVWISVNGADYTVLGTAPEAHLDNANVPAGSINWYIEALSNGCPSTKSTVSHFTVVKAPTGCPDLTAPLMIVPASASSGVQYTISWQPVGGATSYDVQSSNNLQFTGATQSSTTDTQFDFSTTNNTAQPLVKYFRVRALATCQAAPGPFSDASAVIILPSTTAGKQLQGSAPADQTQVISYTIPLDASLAGLTFTATPNQPWITVTPPSGVIPAGGLSLQVQADTDGLPVGTSVGGITITTVAAGSSSKAHTSATSSTVTTVSVSLVSPSLPTSKSTPPPDALIIPAVAHANGINSTFQSDVRVTNTSAQVVKYQVTFTPTGDAGISDGKQTTIDIDPGKTIALDDVLGTWFTSLSQSSIGVLEIRPLTSQSSTTPNPLSPLASSANALSTFASSRTFNVTANGTYGQYIPAIPFASFIGGAKDAASAPVLSLQQISQSDAFRTNLGFVEGSGQPASLLVSVFDHTGAKVTDFPLQLAAGQHTQFSLGSQGVGQLSDGRVEVKVLSSTGKVTTYASVLDNQTNDPLLVSPVNLAAAGNTNFVVPGVADLSNGLANWRTDMRVFNPSSKSVDATLTFYSQNGGTPKSVTMTLAPNEVKDLNGTLASTFGITNDGGAVHITTVQPSNLIATARTYNQTSNGTYGQFIPAVTPSDAAGVGSRPLQLLQLEESDRYRSNVGVVEVSGKPAHIQISVIPPDGRVTGIAEMDLAPNEFRQLNSMLKSFGLGSAYNARVTVKVTSGDGRVSAYASVIDQVTQDPTYIPAQ